MHAADLQELSGQQESLPCTIPLECIQARGNTLPCPKKNRKKESTQPRHGGDWEGRYLKKWVIL